MLSDNSTQISGPSGRLRRVLVNPEVPQEWLQALGPCTYELVQPHEHSWDHSTLLALAREVDGMITLLTDQVDEAVLRAGAQGRLRAVANVAVGVDNIDLRCARELGIGVCNTPGLLSDATADIAMFLILATCRRAFEAAAELREGRWQGWRLTGLLGRDLKGTSLGLIGYGGIAQAVESRAQAFSMHVLHHARRPTGLPGYVGELRELLGQVDVVSLHVPLTADTQGLFDAERLGWVRTGSVLVNTARGEIIDEEALAQALTSGHLAAAGLDVFAHEPEMSPALRRCPNLVVLPHVGSATHATRRAMVELACRGLHAFLAGTTPSNMVEGPGPTSALTE